MRFISISAVAVALFIAAAPASAAPQQKPGEGPVAKASGHWHGSRSLHVKVTARGVRYLIRIHNDYGRTVEFLGGAAAIPTEGISATVAVLWKYTIKDRWVGWLRSALRKGRGRHPVGISMGLYCYHVPAAPDPCRPRVQVRARKGP